MPFTSAQASLGFEGRIWFEPRLPGQRFSGRRHDCALQYFSTHLRRSCRDTGARAARDHPRRPTEPFSGMIGWTPRLSISRSKIGDLGRTSAIAFGRVPGLAAASWRVSLVAIADDQRRRRATRSLYCAAMPAQLTRRHLHFGECPEPGGHAVHWSGSSSFAVDDSARHFHALTRVGRREVYWSPSATCGRQFRGRGEPES